MSNVVYLKRQTDGNEFLCFNKTNLSLIRIYETQECEIINYDEDNFEWSFNYHSKASCVICDKSEFDQALKKFEDTLNEIKNNL